MDAMLHPVVEPTPLKEDEIASVIADLESKLDGKLRCITDIINVMASRAEIIDKTDSCSGCDRNDNLCWYSEPDRETSPIKPMGNTIKRGSASNVESGDDTFGQSGNGVERFDMASDAGHCPGFDAVGAAKGDSEVGTVRERSSASIFPRSFGPDETSEHSDYPKRRLFEALPGEVDPHSKYDEQGEQGEGEEDEGEVDTALSALVEILADAAAGDLNKEGLEKGINIFMKARVAEGEDRNAARAEARDLVKEFQKYTDDLAKLPP